MSRRFAALVLMAALFLFLFVSTYPRRSVAAPDRPVGQVETAGAAYLSKLHPKLQAATEAAKPADSIGVLVYAEAGTDLSRYLDRLLVRPYVMPNGTQAYYGYVKVSQVGKLASLPEVSAIQEMKNPADLPVIPDAGPARIKTDIETRRARLAALQSPDVENPLRRAASGSSEALSARMKVSVDQIPVDIDRIADWFEVLDVHKSRAAWELGYTGAGVKVLVNDSGIDFSHPDLMGTVARISDPASPYYGWPEMFDSYSMWNLASDYFLGTEYIARGVGLAGAAPDYADTGAVRSGSDLAENGDGTYSARFAPIGNTFGHLYRFAPTSKSGAYHFGSHPDTVLAALRYERAAVLVVDEHTAGVYDTVYVDLDADYDFADEKPARKGDEYIYRDLDGDGYADISGGIIYWISDGANPPPVTRWLWGIRADVAGPGDLVAFTLLDSNESGGDHGQLCASGVAAQGVVDGGAPAWKPAGNGTPGTGMVQGGGKGVKLVANGNYYVSPDVTEGYVLAALGYDGLPGTDDDVQIISNSWGFSGTDNDGWDYLSRSVDTILRYLNPTLSELHSIGNGAPGYGTVTSPGAPLAISVGASTLFDSTGGFDSFTGVDQLQYNDVMSWSNRGPTAQGTNGVSVLADGAFAAGDLPLNEVLDGWNAWESWGGTSRSTPVAAGNLALVYEAFRARQGRWPTNVEARAILMAGADSAFSDTLTEGAGTVNAERSVKIAAGMGGVYVLPQSWSFGGYRGRTYEAFANIMQPGETATRGFTVYNAGTTDVRLQIRDEWPVRVARKEFDFTSRDYTSEEGDANRADYLLDITEMIPQGTDLLEVKVVFPFEEFDPDGNYNLDSRWRLHLLDWSDINGDGKLWEDLNGNGVVNCPAGLGSMECEIQAGEYLRFGYAYSAGTSLQQRVRKPLERMHDGVFLALRHQVRSPLVPATHFKIQVNCYRMSDFPWLSTDASVTVPARGTATFNATMTVPALAGVGFYAGVIRLTEGGASGEVSIPVAANVAAFGTDFLFGGPPQSQTPYDNGEVYGYFDWAWRAESGDWRFYFVDVPDSSTPLQAARSPDPAASAGDFASGPGTSFLIDTRWTGPATDIDTMVMGPTRDCFSNGVGCGRPLEIARSDQTVYGPYTLDVVGGSSLLYRGSGRWTYQTSTGGPREIVAAPATPGLNLIALHNVLYDGREPQERFQGQVGTISATPAEVDVRVGEATAGSFPLSIRSSLPLTGLQAEAFGLSAPQTTTGLPQIQDDPNNPATASYAFPLSVRHGARLEVSTSAVAGDMDLYLLYDANADGRFSFKNEVIGASTTQSANELITVTFPPDGDYLAAVHGYNAAVATFAITINAIQGTDLTVTGLPPGPFAANTLISFTVTWTKALMPDQVVQDPFQGVEGLIVAGLPGAEGALQIPVRLRNHLVERYLPYAQKR